MTYLMCPRLLKHTQQTLYQTPKSGLRGHFEQFGKTRHKTKALSFWFLKVESQIILICFMLSE